ncbi:MAG: hypothetical protein KC996_02055 [Phycisphaerales bacterium]|nr:hypothetical protein [Phycisphaerales bacterium]
MPRSGASSASSADASAAGRRVMLINPGPAMFASVIGSAMPDTSRFAAILAANSRGFCPIDFAIPIAALHWKSPNLGWREAVIPVLIFAGSRSGAAAAMAAWNRSSSRAAGSVVVVWAFMADRR